MVPFCLVGLGNIGRNLLDILVHRRDAIVRDYGLDLRLVGAADSRGAAISTEGLNPQIVVDIKSAGGTIADYPSVGQAGIPAVEMVRRSASTMLVEASPTNLTDGEPGMGCILEALGRRQHVVTANKGPLVLAFVSLTARARNVGVALAYSGTVAGGLPTVNIGVRDLAGCSVARVDGIFNGTTNYILTRMEREGIDYREALEGAQAAGIAEADPTLDVDGWDAANKLVIIANSVLRRPTSLADVAVEGIRGVTRRDLQSARSSDRVLKLLAVAERSGDDYDFSVKPTLLASDHPLASTGMWDMGVVYHTDYMGVITAIIEEKGPVPTSAAVLRDMINVMAGQNGLSRGRQRDEW